MLKEERYDKILEILDEEKYTSAAELSSRLFVSLPTIRRDLAELQRRNLIIRSHGGAKKTDMNHTVSPLDFRKALNFSEKRKLCKRASELVDDGDIIFIDASTTAVQMADFLSPKSGITVVTNGIPISVALNKRGIKTFCTGGEIQENSLCYAGSFAESFAESFNFDICFISCYGVNKNAVICDTSLAETALRKTILKASKKSVFLFDKTKFFLSAPYNLADLNIADFIITDETEENEILAKADKEKIIIV